MQKEVIPTCRELGIGIVPYSPLGRGFLTGTITSLDNLQSDPPSDLLFSIHVYILPLILGLQNLPEQPPPPPPPGSMSASHLIKDFVGLVVLISMLCHLAGPPN